MLTRDSTELTDPRVVPSLADRWSHHTGGTHFKVVPSHWRATINVDSSKTFLIATSTRRVVGHRLMAPAKCWSASRTTSADLP